MSQEDLLAKRTALEAQDSIFQSQSLGNKTAVRDLRLLNDQLNAIAYVLRERGLADVTPAPFNNGVGVADFTNA